MTSENRIQPGKKTWLQRFRHSVVGIFIGILLFAGAFPLHYWNEGHTLDSLKVLNEGKDQVVDIDAENYIAANNDKLIHATGFATTKESIVDPAFNLSVNALKYRRIVKIYQWVELVVATEEREPGQIRQPRKLVYYEKRWVSGLVRSGNFQQQVTHHNSGFLPFTDTHLYAHTVNFGEYFLESELSSQINNYTKFNFSQENKGGPDPRLLFVPYQGGYYRGNNPSQPEIGDIKVSFEIVRPETVSIVGRQNGHVLSAYKTKSDGNINLLRIGNYSAEQMFDQSFAKLNLTTWLRRLGGLLMMTIGLNLIQVPLSAISKIIPFAGNSVAIANGWACFLVALALSFAIIANVWIAYRPMLSYLLLALALLSFVFAAMRAATVERQKFARSRVHVH